MAGAGGDDASDMLSSLMAGVGGDDASDMLSSLMAHMAGLPTMVGAPVAPVASAARPPSRAFVPGMVVKLDVNNPDYKNKVAVVVKTISGKVQVRVKETG